MEVFCNNKKLIKLYESGKSTKKYRLTQDIIDKFLMRVDTLESVTTIHDLWNHAALNFEKLKHICVCVTLMIVLILETARRQYLLLI